MFTYFHNHKLKYNKGQLAPFFIVIMVAIVIMALVTVNLSKVALTKTESANSADAGALAAGSIMANVFNSVAKQNGQMEFQFWSSFTAISVSFTIAIGALSIAMIAACSAVIPGYGMVSSCFAAGVASVAWWTIIAIGISVLALKLIQYYTLQIIKDKIAKKGWEGAVKAGHQFVFINSGVGSKLKEGAQRDDFKNFMDSISYAPTYTYSWQDGQGRAHNVTSTVDIDKVNKFEMQTTMLPFLPIAAFLLIADILISIAHPILYPACACSAVPFVGSLCTAVACGSTIPLFIGAMAALAAAWSGLTPTGPIMEDSDEGSILGAVASMWIYTWIDDIDHNRKVEVRTTQHHGGADLGLWTAQYPDTFSSSRVDFKGNGKIHPPKLRHDASIEAVDFP